MTPTDFRACLATLGWTQRGLAGVLGCDERMVRRWAAGTNDVPEPIAAWLERLARHRRCNPPPEGWKRHVASS